MSAVLHEMGDWQGLTDEDGLGEVAAALLDHLKGRKIVALEGELGAGKTHLVQALCRALGVEDQVTSPTFALVQEYRINDSDKVYHLDLYRIRDIDELRQIGFEEMLSEGHWMFIEWPALAIPLLPPDCAWVKITVAESQLRKVVLS